MSKAQTTSSSLATPKSIGRVTRTGLMWAYLRTGFTALIAIPTSMVVARLLTPADFGIAAAATFFGQLAARLTNAGLGNALVRVKVLRDEHISSVFAINMALTTAFVVTLVVTAPLVATFYRSPEISRLMPVVALDFLLGALAMISQTLLTRAMRYKELAAIGSAGLTVQALSTVVFAWFGLGYWSIVFGNVCGSLVVWLAGIRFVGWHLRLRFVPSAARELVSFALGSYAGGMLEYFSQTIDNVVVGRVLGITALGYYDKAFASMNQAYKRLTVAGPSVSFRALAIMQDDHDRFRRAFDKIIITSTFVAYGLFAVLGTSAPHLVVFLFGEKWRPSVVPFQLLCAAGALKISNVYGGAGAAARGWIWPKVWRQMVQLTCIVVGVYLASAWGINGASGAVLASTVIMFVLTQSLLRAATGLSWRDLLQPHVPGVVLAVTATALLWAMDAAMRPASIPSSAVLVIEGVAAAILAWAFVWWCPFREVRAVIFEIASDMAPRLTRWLPRRYSIDVVDQEKGISVRKSGDVPTTTETAI
jgi:PST family polysaccharide transporter